MLRKRWGWGYTKGFGEMGTSYLKYTNGYVNFGSALDDLADGAFTFDGWIRPDTTDRGTVISKGATEGWRVYTLGGALYAEVDCGTTQAQSIVSGLPVASWIGITVTFDDAGDRKLHCALNGVWQSYAVQTAGVGAIVSDAANDLWIGGQPVATAYSFDGGIGWTRLSNTVRYPVGVDFYNISRQSILPSDPNTLALWNTKEASGLSLADSASSNNGAIVGDVAWAR